MSTPTRPRRAWLGLAFLALPCMITVMDLTVLNLALPRLSAALKPSGAQLLWIIDIYGFVLAGALIPIGGLGDRIGRRKLLLIGAAAFGGPSVLPEFRDAGASRPDLLSGLLSIASVLAVIYGLKQMVQEGVAWLPMLSMVVGLGLAAIFVRRQRQLADPMLDLTLFENRAF